MKVRATYHLRRQTLLRAEIVQSACDQSEDESNEDAHEDADDLVAQSPELELSILDDGSEGGGEDRPHERGNQHAGGEEECAGEIEVDLSEARFLC